MLTRRSIRSEMLEGSEEELEKYGEEQAQEHKDTDADDDDA